MKKFLFCRRCLYHISHPLGLVIDESGICSGCRIHEEKDKIDWKHRWEDLKNLVKPYRRKLLKNYDCIIPVTGSQDSYFTVFIVKEKLGLNPLLVNYNKYFNTPIGIANLANLRIRFNVDILFQNINPEKIKKITRTTLKKFGSIYWPILAGHTAFPVHIAIHYKIPLIIWGAHQGVEQVGMFSHLHSAEMTRRYRKEHDLMGYEADDLISIFDTLKEDDIRQFRYPDDADINSIGVRGVYLSNYIRWDPKSQHELMIKKYGYITTKFSRTFDKYDYVDCYNYMNLHDYLKLLKHGYSKVTDHATREIRHGRITREEGLSLVKKFELKLPSNTQMFLDWIGADQNSLNFILDRHRNKMYWSLTDSLKYKFNGLSTMNTSEDKKIKDKISKTFILTENPFSNFKDQYITFGKGFI
jgi:N-acetyl sugar amidotransferase